MCSLTIHVYEQNATMKAAIMFCRRLFKGTVTWTFAFLTIASNNYVTLFLKALQNFIRAFHHFQHQMS